MPHLHEQVIWSYQPDPLSTAAFFFLAALGAVSLLVTWLLGLAAVGVTGVYAITKVAETAQVSRDVVSGRPTHQLYPW